MTLSPLVDRYARAVFELAAETGLQERVADELDACRRLLDAHRELRDCLLSPFVPGACKRAVVADLCAAIWHPLTINFLRLLIEKRRLPILAEIARRVNELLRESRGILAVKLTLALAPAPAQLAALRERLARIFERQVELETAVDPELLGGIVIQAADRLVDGSCRGQLDRIRTELAVT